jgi:hypothetical protein
VNLCQWELDREPISGPVTARWLVVGLVGSRRIYVPLLIITIGSLASKIYGWHAAVGRDVPTALWNLSRGAGACRPAPPSGTTPGGGSGRC